MRRTLAEPTALREPSGGVIKTDVLIVGAGIAGLYTALQLDPALRCLILTKEGVQTSNSWLAQGGIAAAVDAVNDHPALHREDTFMAGAGLCDEEAVKILVEEGPRDIETLAAMRVPFDLNEDGDLSITREGGHTRDRVVHAGGDATGRETVKVLASLVQACPNIGFFPYAFFLDCLTDDQGRIAGALIYNGAFQHVETRVIVICTGGAGQIYQNTTNPPVATGDGLAAALRAGARVKGMEFIQFHPTALYQPERSGSRFLISEAVRGEGGLLYDINGERFMLGEHPMAELAPRDIVARAIQRRVLKTGHPCVYLDVTARGHEFLAARFPTITAQCAACGLDIGRQRIPVGPVQHYMIGGLETDLTARTSIPGLYACGEAACTGVHGANRLASNSMLECLVFGRRAAEHIGSLTWETPRAAQTDAGSELTQRPPPGAADTVRAICERDAGIVRTSAGLTRGHDEVGAIRDALDLCRLTGKADWETYNLTLTAAAVFTAALARPGSVGAHYREN